MGSPLVFHPQQIFEALSASHPHWDQEDLRTTIVDAAKILDGWFHEREKRVEEKKGDRRRDTMAETMAMIFCLESVTNGDEMSLMTVRLLVESLHKVYCVKKSPLEPILN